MPSGWGQARCLNAHRAPCRAGGRGARHCARPISCTTTTSGCAVRSTSATPATSRPPTPARSTSPPSTSSPGRPSGLRMADRPLTLRDRSARCCPPFERVSASERRPSRPAWPGNALTRAPSAGRAAATFSAWSAATCIPSPSRRGRRSSPSCAARAPCCGRRTAPSSSTPWPASGTATSATAAATSPTPPPSRWRTLEAYSCFEPFTNPTGRRPHRPPAERCRRSRRPRVFLCGSGSEAVDTAIKLARLTHHLAGDPQRTVVVSRERGYHGTNLGGTSAQGIAPNREGWGPLVPDVIQVPADDIEALSVMMSQARRRDRRRADRAGAGRRRRVPATRRVPRRGAGAVRPPRRAAHLRRGDHRLRPSRHVVRRRSTSASCPT